MTEQRTATSLEELPEIARWIIARAGQAVITFDGEMGSGKTTLIKAICKSINVEDEVSSPTYSLVNEYYSEQFGTVYHFDLYRLDDPSEAMDMGIEEYLDSGQLCLIEWPEKIRNLLPTDIVEVKILSDNGKREFVLKTKPNE